MATGHRPRRMVENADSDYVAVCSCGWRSEPKPVEEIAKSVLAEHIAEAEAAVSEPEAESILAKVEAASLRAGRGAVQVTLTAGEAAFLRRVLAR